jgi:hypothetical protein
MNDRTGQKYNVTTTTTAADAVVVVSPLVLVSFSYPFVWFGTDPSRSIQI